MALYTLQLLIFVTVIFCFELPPPTTFAQELRSSPKDDIDSGQVCPSFCRCTVDQEYREHSQQHKHLQQLNSHDNSTTPIRIDCSRNNLTNVQDLVASVTSKFTNSVTDDKHQSRLIVTSLILSANLLESIEPSKWSLLQQWTTTLTELDLSGNRIDKIESDAFSAFRSLHTLNLANNEISEIHVFAFRGLRRLRTLNLASNILTLFPSSQISPSLLHDLSELNLANNRIQWIPERAFLTSLNKSREFWPRNVKLSRLELSGNPLVRVHSEAFVHLNSLVKLELSQLEAQQHFPSFEGCHRLEELRLDRNKLRYIDSALCHHVGRTLKSLKLNSNKITTIGSALKQCTELRLLDMSYNELKTLSSVTFPPDTADNGREGVFSAQHKLIDLALDHNQIVELESDTFAGLSSLKVLNLESNTIERIDSNTFLPLSSSLRDLNLGKNVFDFLPTAGLERLIELKAHGNRNLRNFPPVEELPAIASLALSYAYHCCPYVGRTIVTEHDPDNHNQQIVDQIIWADNRHSPELNMSLEELAQQFWSNTAQPQASERVSLDFTSDLFPPGQLLVSSVDTPWSTEQMSGVGGAINFNPPPVAPKYIKCIPTPDPFMPCQDLFDWWTLRVGVWIVFPLALLANGFVLIVLLLGTRLRKRRRRTRLDVPRFLVCHLAAADLFMGVYLAMLALVDARTLGNFRKFAIAWQYSWGCQFTGFVGVFSAELSVYTLAVITLERNYAITHAMHLNKRLSLRAASTVMAIGWLFALAMALAPMFGISDYRKFAVCLPIETDNSRWSMIYVLGLIASNGVAFALLMACYLRMYCAIRGSQAWNSNEWRIAARMALLVFTDFLCWAPIAFFSLTAIAGWNLVSLEEAKVFTVFVLPLNACANPFLYAFFTKQFKKECTILAKRIENFTAPVTDLWRRASQNQNRKESHSDPRFTPGLLVAAGPTRPDALSTDRGCLQCCPRVHSASLPLADESVAVHSADCNCQCHHLRQQQQQQQQLKKSLTSTASSFFVWRRTPADVNNKKRAAAVAQRLGSGNSRTFKSNSIVYQSNYRKNHIHMTLENEYLQQQQQQHLQLLEAEAHSKSTRILSSKQQNQSRASLPNCNSSISVEFNNANCAAQRTSRDYRSPIEIVLERASSPAQNYSSSATPTGREETEFAESKSSFANRSSSSMANSILQLKNKFVSNSKQKANIISEEHLYHLSNFDNRRKDSTSTIGGARLSFSSELPTKSTCSSMMSSGFHSNGSGHSDLPHNLKPPRFSYSEEDEFVEQNNNNNDDQEEEDEEFEYEDNDDDGSDDEVHTSQFGDCTIWQEAEKRLFLSALHISELTRRTETFDNIQRLKSLQNEEELSKNQVSLTECQHALHMAFKSGRTLELNFHQDSYKQFLLTHKCQHLLENSKNCQILQHPNKLLFLFEKSTSQEDKKNEDPDGDDEANVDKNSQDRSDNRIGSGLRAMSSSDIHVIDDDCSFRQLDRLNVYGIVHRRQQHQSGEAAALDGQEKEDEGSEKNTEGSRNEIHNVPIECIDCLHHFLIDQLLFNNSVNRSPEQCKSELHKSKVPCLSTSPSLSSPSSGPSSVRVEDAPFMTEEMTSSASIALLECTVYSGEFNCEQTAQFVSTGTCFLSGGSGDVSMRKTTLRRRRKKRRSEENVPNTSNKQQQQQQQKQQSQCQLLKPPSPNLGLTPASSSEKLRKSPLQNRLLSSSHEILRSFIQNFLPSGSTGNSGNPSSRRLSSWARISGKQKNVKSSKFQRPVDSRRRSSSAFVLSDLVKQSSNSPHHHHHHHLHHGRSPDARELIAVSSCTQLTMGALSPEFNSAKGDNPLAVFTDFERPESRSSSSFVVTEPEIERCRSALSDTTTSGGGGGAISATIA